MNTLISATELKRLIASANVPVLLADCRFNLAKPDEGEQLFVDTHLPDAVYLHLDRDLSAPVTPGVTGRHPLPDKAAFLAKLRSCGFSPAHCLVAYDASGGAFAARAWWLAQWAGIEQAFVLDGGMQAWDNDKSTLAATQAQAAGEVVVVEAAEIGKPEYTPLVDAREEIRFRGDVEPIDPVAGHIPGAQCLPFPGNLDDNGYFHSRAVLRKRFAPLYQSGQTPVMYCGSGVTAAHNCLAAVHAGFPMPRLYAGSWSEWITDPSRPTARGD
ncbi:sulfurtransferase [Granulosicoccaceae sp. 1_MG-2023]|nr:sulfurtransferase [Granulosicoccaceae sp. 1_MG-2023]